MPTLNVREGTNTIDYQLKRVYGQKITDLFANHTMTYNLFDKSDRKAKVIPGGAGYYFSTRQANIESTGARIEGAYLPEPLAGDGVQGVIVPKLIYSVVRISGLAVSAGKGDVTSFVNAQGDAVMNAYRALTVDLNRQCHGDGFGQLATLSTSSDSLSTTTTWTITCANDVGVRYLRKGMIVDFYDSTGATVDASATASRIQSIDPVNQTCEMEAVNTTGSGGSSYQAYHPNSGSRTATIATDKVPTGSIVVRYGAREDSHATTDTHRELMGLEGLYDDGSLLTTFEGINTSNDPEFKANILSNSSVDRELSIDLMLAAIDTTAAKSDSKSVELMRLGMGQRRKYFGLLAPDIRFTPTVLKGGYETLSFSQNGAIEIVVDPTTQPNRIYFEPRSAIKKYELEPIGWGGFDPNKMHWREDYDEATMFLRTYTNLGVEERQSLTLLKDLTEPSNAPW